MFFKTQHIYLIFKLDKKLIKRLCYGLKFVAILNPYEIKLVKNIRKQIVLKEKSILRDLNTY